MSKIIVSIASISGILAVSIGAFGAHGLKNILTKHQTADVFETGSKYHFYHTIVLLFIGLWMQLTKDTSTQMNYAAYCFIAGILIFSGSLYILAVTNIKILGAITPIGGLFFIAGWGLLLTSFLK